MLPGSAWQPKRTKLQSPRTPKPTLTIDHLPSHVIVNRLTEMGKK